MASADKASADSKRDSAPRAERAADTGTSRVAQSDTLLAAGQALRERLGNRAFGGLVQRASAPPPNDPSHGPFANTAVVRVAAFHDPLERDAERAIDAPGRTSRHPHARPNLLSPVDSAATSALRSISGPGAPLDSSLRIDAERSLGVDLPTVRLFRTAAPHTLGTRAFAYGSDVFVSPNAPAPSTPAGRALLLHELAHVHQQELIGEPFIQREPPPTHTTEGDWEIEKYSTGYDIRTNKKEHKLEIVVGGKTWIRMSAPKAEAMPGVTVAWGSASVGDVTVAQKVGIVIQTEADITITVDQDVEDEVFSRLQGKTAAIVYKFSGGGTATFTATSEETFATGERQLAFGLGGTVVKQKLESSRDFALPMTMMVTEERNPPRLNSDAPLHPPPIRSEQITIDKLPNSFPTFDTAEEVKKFLEAQPKRDFVVLQMPDGKFVARAVDEQQMKALTQSIREGRTNFNWLPNLRRYNGKAATGKFLTFWLHGKEYTSPDAIRDLYYFNEVAADVGTSDSPPECEVYRMGPDSFGRRPLMHAEAVMLLTSFDKMSKDEVYKRQVEGFPFFSMRFQGKAALHIIDERYFDGRETFKTNAVKYQDAIKQGTPLDVRRGPFDALNSLDVEHFLGIELDREQDNPEFIALLKGADSALRLVAKFVWRQVTHKANYIATREITKGIEQLKAYQDDQMLRGVVLTFAQLSVKQKKDTLDFLGVDTALQDDFTTVLSDRSRAWRVAQGRTELEMYKGPLVGGGAVPPPKQVSLDILRAAVTTQIENLRKTIEALNTVGSDGEYTFNALTAKGDFGLQVRTTTYRDLGINLDPKQWPHGNVSPGWFPSPLEGDRAKFGSTFEQIYANESNSHDSWDFVATVLKVTAMAIAAAIIILIAHVAAAALVAALGLEGIAAFAVYTGVNAAILTGAEVLQAKLIEGKNPTLAGVIESFIKNLVMVGGFTKFGAALEGVSSVARTSIMGATFLGLSLTERLLHGGFDNPRDFFLWFYENIVMFAALEAGGQLIRPLDVRIQFWGRARRLGILVPEIDALTGDIGKLQNRLADLMQTPHRANLEAPKLQAESRRLLELQKDLAKQVAAKVKDTNDPEAKFVADELKKELESVDQALAAMQEADFLFALQISPAGDAPNVFEYKPSANAVEAIKKFFPKDTKVETSSDGVIRVTIPGRGDPFVLYPEGHAKLPVPKKGSIESKLNLNNATADDIVNAEIPGVGKDTAEKIVEGRKKKGGTFDSFDDLLKIKDIGSKTVEKLKASGKVEIAPQEKVNVIETQKALAGRIDAIVARARRLNIKDKAIDALAKKQIGSFEEDLLKDRAEIDKVDKALENKIEKAGARARKRYEKRKTTPKDWLAQVKVERLAGVSDEVINEALSQIPSGKKSRVTRLGPRQIRAIVLAHMEGAPIRRFLETGKDFTVAQRNRALDLYLDAAEHRIKGAGRVLSEMSLQASKFRGGLFVLERAEYFGFANIKEFEMPARLGDSARFVDMVLKGDTIWVECKDWAEWERNNPAKLASQFRRDIVLREYDASVFKKLRYVFRKPAPRPVAEIKAFLREALVLELNEARAADVITAQQQQDLLKAFDDEADLVAETALRDEHTLLPPDPGSAKPSTIAPVPPPVPSDDDEDDDEGDE